MGAKALRLRFLPLILSLLLVTGLSVTNATANPIGELQKLILERMPGYQLTEKWNGKRVTVSPAYSLEAHDGLLPRTATVQQVLANFVSRHEKTGLRPVQMYLTDGNFLKPEYWKVDFPGCRPRQCSAEVANSTFSHTSKKQKDKFAGVASTNPERIAEIVSAEIFGVKYQAILWIRYDSRGRVIKYYVRGYNEATTPREKRWAARGQTRLSKLPIPVLEYANNLVLGVDALILEPGKSHISRNDQLLKGL